MATSPEAGAPTIAELLRHERQRSFVGRASEIEAFERLLRELSHPVWFVQGQAGVGKTALLHELCRVALAHGVHPVLLEAERFASQTGVAPVLPVPPAAGPATLRATARWVLLIDAFERLENQGERALRGVVATLPADALVVIASRAAPPADWSLDPGWRRLCLRHHLSSLNDHESFELLQRRGAPAGAQRAILDFAAGYPLALTLATEVILDAGSEAFTFECLQGAQQRLLCVLDCEERAPGQSLALDVLSIARTTTAELLDGVRQQLNVAADAPEVFAWLGRQPFIEWTPSGLRPHALVRAALNARLRRERPKRFRLIFQIVREYCLRELESGQDPDAELTNLLFLDRHAPVVRSWSRPVDEQPERRLKPLARGAGAEVIELVRDLEGSHASRIVAAYLEADEAFEVVRGERVEALLHVARFTATSGPSRLPSIDPIAVSVRRFVAANPLQRHEEAVLFRWFCDRDGYQAPTASVLTVTGRQTQLLLGVRALAYSLCVFRNVADWEPLWKTIGTPWTLVDRFRLDDHDYALIAFDWRKRPLRELLANAWRQPAEPEGPRKETSFDELRVMVTGRVAKLARLAQLTKRETEILERLCLGLSLDDIGRQLSIRPRTVKFHQENLLRKTGVSSRTDLFRKLL